MKDRKRGGRETKKIRGSEGEKHAEKYGMRKDKGRKMGKRKEEKRGIEGEEGRERRRYVENME